MHNSIANQVLQTIDESLNSLFPTHPYRDGVTRENFAEVMANYAAMSQAFPYLQAGASYRVYAFYERHGMPVARNGETTAVVGAFLTWDEFAGHGRILAKGSAGLCDVLDTSEFHANLLLTDLARLTDTNIQPRAGDVTKRYLQELLYGLSSIDPTTRVAHMVGFERHANNMIAAVWARLSELFDCDPDSLKYFRTHVGGDDPAEAYHVELTSRMVASTIPADEEGRFADEVVSAYRLSYEWSRQLTQSFVPRERQVSPAQMHEGSSA
jgi:hypothetical protein